MSQKIYLTILKIGAYLSFLSVFLVSGRLFFPYITTKQIYFNILVEILFIFWAAFIIQYPSWRPKRSLISLGLLAFATVITISSFFGVDFNLSFWGDAERMLGVFHVVHFFIFYLILITIMRSWKDWRNLMNVSVIAALFISLYSLKVTYATIGNAAYVGGYLIFNIYFSLILFFHSHKKNIWRWLYMVVILFMLISLKKTGVAGAYVGLGFSAIVGLFLFGILSKEKKIRTYTLSVFVLSLVLIMGIFFSRNTFAVKNVQFLNDILAEVSLGKNTFQTRLISWKTAWKDFPSHPLLGSGYGNFAITFDKYFEPSFYNYTRSETYFDRAHNNLVDIASTSGALGLLAYLSILTAAGYYLIVVYRKNKATLFEFVLLSSLLIAYFVQNLVVFDSLVTYIPLMAVLGYIYWLVQDEKEVKHENDASFSNKDLLVVSIIGLAVLTVLFKYNVGPLKMLKGTIDGQIAFAQGDIIKGVESYKDALSHNTILDRDSRDSFIRFVTPGLLDTNMDKSKIDEIVEFAQKEVEKNIKYNPDDSLTQTELAQFLTSVAQINKNDDAKFSLYLDQAMQAADKAINASPGRIPLYYVKARIYDMRGDKKNALATLEYAANLNDQYYDSFCNLARYYFVMQDQEKGFLAMDKCIDLGGAETLTPLVYVDSLVNFYMERDPSWLKVTKLYERLVKLKADDAIYWVKLAASYERIHEYEKARDTALKVAELDPTLKDDVEQFISAMKKNGTLK